MSYSERPNNYNGATQTAAVPDPVGLSFQCDDRSRRDALCGIGSSAEVIGNAQVLFRRTRICTSEGFINGYRFGELKERRFWLEQQCGHAEIDRDAQHVLHHRGDRSAGQSRVRADTS